MIVGGHQEPFQKGHLTTAPKKVHQQNCKVLHPWNQPISSKKKLFRYLDLLKMLGTNNMLIGHGTKQNIIL